MNRKTQYRESGENDELVENFDYTKLQFPDKANPEQIDRTGSEYIMGSTDFDEMNKDYLRGANVSFVIGVEVSGHWQGKYRPATRIDPPEYPEYEIDDVRSDVVCIYLDTDDKSIDITDKFPRSSQATSDVNKEWYGKYVRFISQFCSAVEEKECERVADDPPEYEPYYDMDDYYESSENYDEEEDEDGWNDYYLEDSGLFEVLDEIRDMEYEVRNCVRGGNTGCKTYQELGNYVSQLGERLSDAGENIKYIS